MDKYFKRFSIMFVMLLAMIGVGAIQHESVANAATVGEQLKTTEDGWKRYDDTDSNFKYVGDNWAENKSDNWINNNNHTVNPCTNEEVKFKFYGSKFRIIQSKGTTINTIVDVYVDNVLAGTFSNYNSSLFNNILVFEKTGLEFKEHSVTVKLDSASTIKRLFWDSLDIDKTGYLLPYNESITLNNSTITLPVENTQQLIPATTPAGVQVTWTSDNTEVATVEPTTGKVTGVKEGMCTITATTADGATAKCTVTVTPKGKETNPSAGDGNLFIELVDGQIKSYQATASQIEDFKQWYLDRDNTKSNKPYYHFTKGTYNDYVVHDKIDWFEVR